MPEKDPGYIKYLKNKVICCLCARWSDGEIEAHHVRAGGNAGVGMKPDDKYCIPICFRCHRVIHNNGYSGLDRPITKERALEFAEYYYGRYMESLQDRR